jgi:hypothetical protein
MSDVIETRLIACPYSQARRYLASAITSQGTRGKPSIMRLRVKIPGELNVEKDVAVTFAPATDPRHFDQPWRVHWEPSPPGPYPVFDGTLTVRSAEDYDSAILELSGRYEPPLGSLGKIFDAAIGHHLAQATARDLLAAIGDRMEAAFQRQEAAKKG